MKGILQSIIGASVLVIGGTVFTINQADLVNNFSKETGMSQQAAEEYVNSISDDDLGSFNELGSELISEGQDSVRISNEIDCINYEYEWESYTLSCNEGKSQLRRIGESEQALGRAYRVLDTEDATERDISAAIGQIDRLNNNLDLEIVEWVFDASGIDEYKKTNAYNKALLQAALDGQ